MKIIYILSGLLILIMLTGCGQGFSEGGYFNDGKSLAAEAQAGISEIAVAELQSRMEAGELRVVIDVREPDEFEEGFINQPDEDFEYQYTETFTVNIARGILEFKIADKTYWDDELWLEMPPKEEAIVVYSRTGKRSALAAQALLQMGYKEVKSLKGGYRKWLDPHAPDEEEVKSSGGCG